MLSHGLPWPTMWDPHVGFGLDVGPWLPSFPLWEACAIFNHLGMSWPLIERLVWLIPLVILIVAGPYICAFVLTRSTTAACFAALYYSLNTWTVGLIQRGHIPSLCAYSLIPLAFAILVQLRSRRPLLALALAGVLALQIAYDVRYAYLTVAVAVPTIAVWLFSGDWRRRFSSIAINIAIVVVVLGTSTLYWIVPGAIAPVGLLDSVLSGHSISNILSFQDWQQAFAGYYPFYHYVDGTGPFAPTPTELPFYLFPVIVVLGLYYWRNRTMSIWIAIVATAGILFATSDRSIFGPPIVWLMRHVPGLFMYRETTKFDSITYLAYAIAIAFAVDRFTRLNWNRKVIGVVLVSALGGYVLLMHAAYDPSRGSNFSALNIRRQDHAVTAYLEKHSGNTVSVFVPTVPLSLFSTERHTFAGLADLRADFPLDDGTEPFLTYLGSSILPQEISLLNVAHFVLADDPGETLFRRYSYLVQYDRALALLRSLPWLKEGPHFGRYVVFDVRPRPLGLVSAPRTPALLRGGPKNVAALDGSDVWKVQPGIVDVASIPKSALSEVERVLPNQIDGIWTGRANVIGPSEGSRYHAATISRYSLSTLEQPFIGPLRGTLLSVMRPPWRGIARADAVAPFVMAYRAMLPARAGNLVENRVPLDGQPVLLVTVASFFERNPTYQMKVRSLRTGEVRVISAQAARASNELVCDLWGDASRQLTKRGVYADDFEILAVTIPNAPPGALHSAITLTLDSSVSNVPLERHNLIEHNVPYVRTSAGMRKRDVVATQDGLTFMVEALSSGESATFEVPLIRERAHTLQFDAFVPQGYALTMMVEIEDGKTRRFISASPYPSQGRPFGEIYLPWKTPIPEEEADFVLGAHSAGPAQTPISSRAFRARIDLDTLRFFYGMSPSGKFERAILTLIATDKRSLPERFTLADFSEIQLEPARCHEASLGVQHGFAVANAGSCVSSFEASKEPIRGLRTVPSEGIGSILVERGVPERQAGGVFHDARFLDPSIAVARADSNSRLIAFAQLYSPWWKAITMSEDPAKLSIEEVWRRLASSPETVGAHVRVNASINGWITNGPTKGWIVFGYMSSLAARRFAIFALVAVLIEVMVVVALAFVAAKKPSHDL